jgi:hypothetical protein
MDNSFLFFVFIDDHIQFNIFFCLEKLLHSPSEIVVHSFFHLVD